MSSLSVKQKAALLQSGFSKGYNSLNNKANRRTRMAANLAGVPMTSANHDPWNNNNKGNNFNNALSANGEIPANLFVSPPGSPTGLNNNSASNVGSVASASAVAAQAVAAQEQVAAENVAAADPYAITPNKMAKAKAKFNKINANRRAAAAAAAAAPVSAAASVAAPSSSFSPFNMYTGLSSVPVNQGPVYGPEFQAEMARAFSTGATEAAKMGADWQAQQEAGRAAAQYAEVMKITRLNNKGKLHYVGQEAEAKNRASAAAKAANAARAAAAANPVAPARHWGTVQTGHRGAHRKSRKNRRSGRKSRKNHK